MSCEKDRDFEYDSVTMAKAMVAYANANGYSITMTKLQKLLYIAYGVYLATGKGRLVDEHPQAWPYGPVFPHTREQLLNKLSECESSKEIDENPVVSSLIDAVYKAYGNYSASTLSQWSHKKDSPWDETIKGDDCNLGNEIPDYLIKDYFSRLLGKK